MDRAERDVAFCRVYAGLSGPFFLEEDERLSVGPNETASDPDGSPAQILVIAAVSKRNGNSDGIAFH
jgi:hypothetical protein